MRISAFALLCLVAFRAEAHKSGFHKKNQVSIRPGKVEALVSMDVDSGQRCSLLRQAADADRNGTLSASEIQALKQRLVNMALKSFRVSISGFAVEGSVGESKIDLRGDFSGSTSGMSVAVLWEARVSNKLSEGMRLEVEDAAPDNSHVRVEIQQLSSDGSLLKPLEVMDIQRSGKASVRLEVQKKK